MVFANDHNPVDAPDAIPDHLQHARHGLRDSETPTP
jgi:hypothetical protein